MCVLVKLVRIGQKVEEFEVSDDPTIAGLMDVAGVDYKPGTITVNQDVVDEDFDLEDGDVVYMGNAMKGNVPFTVKIIRLGNAEPIIELPSESGMSIKQLLDSLPPEERAKFYRADGTDVYEYRINGSEALNGNATIPTPGDATTPVRLVMSTRTKGNN